MGDRLVGEGRLDRNGRLVIRGRLIGHEGGRASQVLRAGPCRHGRRRQGRVPSRRALGLAFITGVVKAGSGSVHGR